MGRKMLLSALFALVGVSWGDDLTLKDGRVLKNYKIHKVTPTGLVIFHDSGGLTAGPDLLPDELSKKHNLTKQSVTAAKAKQKDQAAKLTAKKKILDAIRESARLVRLTVFQALDDGALVKDAFFYKVQTKQFRTENSISIKKELACTGVLDLAYLDFDSKNVVDGSELDVVVFRNGVYRYTPVEGGTNTVPKFVDVETFLIELAISEEYGGIQGLKEMGLWDLLVNEVDKIGDDMKKALSK